MATRLTTTAVLARKAIKIGIVTLVVIIIGRLILLTVYRAVVSTLPEKEQEATLGFGLLPPIGFPEQTNELPILEYTVETPSGTLPEFPSNLPVYVIEQKFANLFSYDTMRQTANIFGFSGLPNQDVFNERKYIFRHSTVPSTMEFDIVTQTFSISYNLSNDSTPLSFRSKTPTEARTSVEERLSAAQILPAEEIELLPTNHIFLKVEGQNLVRALALADAQLIQINLFRENIGATDNFEGYKSITADPNKGNIWFIISGAIEREKQIIAGEYKYFNVDSSLFQTYPIKTPERALRDLVEGNGYVANLGFNVDGKVTITDVYLAYFDPNVPESFYQPVVVFEGRDDFIAYVSAVESEYISE